MQTYTSFFVGSFVILLHNKFESSLYKIRQEPAIKQILKPTISHTV